SLAAARHTGCAGVVQRVSRDARGRIRRLGSEERVFNRYQRRAIALRDGGCIIPGCGTPAAWCEIHHVIDHAKGGATHTDNGVLLCWFHHRFIDTGPWRVRMNRGVPEVQAPPWFDRSGRWRPVTTSRTRMLDLIGGRT
ncbi:MAG: HNH endonuclease, partial [Microbacterium sp.]